MIPDEISHRTLIDLLKSAQKDLSTDTSQNAETDLINLKLRRWSDETIELLNNMAATPESFGINRTTQQVMALGSFRTHLMLGLQALKASQS